MSPRVSGRKIRITVQWVNGEWKPVDDCKLPAVKGNAEAMLVIAADLLANDAERSRWLHEYAVPLLDKGTELFARINPEKVPEELVEKLSRNGERPAGPSCSVKIVLDGRLDLILSLGQMGRLANCPCRIPVLNQNADSVNEAYKKIVTVFEKKRRSNVGNVFLLVSVKQNCGDVKLDVLRQQKFDEVFIWEKLGTNWLQVCELFDQATGDLQATGRQDDLSRNWSVFVSQQTGGDALLKQAQTILDYRRQLESQPVTGLPDILCRFNDPTNTSPEILRLRDLRGKLDRDVLAAFGWYDPARVPACEFLPESQHRPHQGSGASDETRRGECRDTTTESLPDNRKLYRYRWPDEFRDNVRMRMLDFCAQHDKQEVLAGKAGVEFWGVGVGGEGSWAGDRDAGEPSGDDEPERQAGLGQTAARQTDARKSPRKSKKSPAAGQRELGF